MDIKVIKLKVRRGTNDQRKQISFDEGELGYTVDTQRLYIGNGLTTGGIPVSQRVHLPLLQTNSLTGLSAEIGDLATANNAMYQLIYSDSESLSSWSNISQKVDTNVFSYSNQNVLTLSTSGISAFHIHPSTFSGGISSNNIDSIVIGQGGISAFHIHPSTFSGGISSNNIDSIVIGQGGITPFHIHPSTFIDGIVSNNIDRIGITANGISAFQIHPSTFGSSISSNSNGIVVAASGISAFQIHPSTFKGGISSNNIDSIVIASSGVSAMNIHPGTIDSSLFYFNNNQITSNLQTIFDTITGYDLTTKEFNGDPLNPLNMLVGSGTSRTQIRAISALDTGGTTYINLSSAGFITFLGNKPSSNKQRTPARYAIPIFSW